MHEIWNFRKIYIRIVINFTIAIVSWNIRILLVIDYFLKEFTILLNCFQQNSTIFFGWIRKRQMTTFDDIFFWILEEYSFSLQYAFTFEAQFSHNLGLCSKLIDVTSLSIPSSFLPKQKQMVVAQISCHHFSDPKWLLLLSAVSFFSTKRSTGSGGCKQPG